jgi:type IV pilus assembly protein PilW
MSALINSQDIKRKGLRSQRGLSLIELMIALALGTIVALAAITIFISNSRTYATAEGLGRIQENSGITYELMARDIRAAGATACSKNIPIASTLSAGSEWWKSWGGGLLGFDNGALAGSAAGTDALQIMSASDVPVTIISHSPSAGTMVANKAVGGISAKDVAFICDYRQASMFQVNSVSGSTISYVNGGLNCTKDMTFPSSCASVQPGIQFASNSVLTRLHAVRWYVASNGRGGTSLYQLQLQSNGATVAQEVAEGVSDMQLKYLLPGATSYVDSGGVSAANWRKVLAVRISLTMTGGENQNKISSSRGVLSRKLEHVVTIRNHAL